jgi:hypothetical protein
MQEINKEKRGDSNISQVREPKTDTKSFNTVRINNKIESLIPHLNKKLYTYHKDPKVCEEAFIILISTFSYSNALYIKTGKLKDAVMNLNSTVLIERFGVNYRILLDVAIIGTRNGSILTLYEAFSKGNHSNRYIMNEKYLNIKNKNYIVNTRDLIKD